MLRALIHFEFRWLARSGQMYWKTSPVNDETKKNSNDAIADVVEISVGRVTLKDGCRRKRMRVAASIN